MIFHLVIILQSGTFVETNVSLQENVINLWFYQCIRVCNEYAWYEPTKHLKKQPIMHIQFNRLKETQISLGVQLEYLQ